MTYNWQLTLVSWQFPTSQRSSGWHPSEAIVSSHLLEADGWPPPDCWWLSWEICYWYKAVKGGWVAPVLIWLKSLFELSVAFIGSSGVICLCPKFDSNTPALLLGAWVEFLDPLVEFDDVELCWVATNFCFDGFSVLFPFLAACPLVEFDASFPPSFSGTSPLKKF